MKEINTIVAETCIIEMGFLLKLPRSNYSDITRNSQVRKTVVFGYLRGAVKQLLESE